VPDIDKLRQDATLPDFQRISTVFDGKEKISSYDDFKDVETQYKAITLYGHKLHNYLRLNLSPITQLKKDATSGTTPRLGTGAIGEITHLSDSVGGPIKLLDYSTTSVVVFGLGTKAIKDELKANYRAFWNSRLSYKSDQIMGWVIKKEYKDAIVDKYFK
jgi:hypothetical protein